MRRLMIAAAAVAAIAGAGSLMSGRAEAMPMAAPVAGITASESAAEPVALVCRRVWNGFRWVQRCYRTAPRYFGPRPYYRPRYYRY